MSIPRNLGNFADNVDTNGQVSLTTGVTGTLPVANGGTGQTTYTNGQLLIGNTTGNTLAKATLTQGSGISITNGAGSITIAATGGGTVTSVATGNGLSGGTITSSGTLTVAAPSWNSVGSYAMVVSVTSSGTRTFTSGSDYAAGSGNNQLQSAALISDAGGMPYANNLSGTWRWMSTSWNSTAADSPLGGIACRVS